MIESMKIRKGLVFTLPIEPSEVKGKDCDKTEYIYKIGKEYYQFYNNYPLKLKVVKVLNATVLCNATEDKNAFGIDIPIPFEEIAKNGTATKEEKEEMVNHPNHYAWLKELCGIEAIDICRHLDFNCGSAIKYLLRKGKKEMNLSEREQRVQDLSKAIFYLQDEIKMLENQK